MRRRASKHNKHQAHCVCVGRRKSETGEPQKGSEKQDSRTPSQRVKRQPRVVWIIIQTASYNAAQEWRGGWAAMSQFWQPSSETRDRAASHVPHAGQAYRSRNAHRRIHVVPKRARRRGSDGVEKRGHSAGHAVHYIARPHLMRELQIVAAPSSGPGLLPSTGFDRAARRGLLHGRDRRADETAAVGNVKLWQGRGCKS